MMLKRPSLFIRVEFSDKLLKQDVQNIISSGIMSYKLFLYMFSSN